MMTEEHDHTHSHDETTHTHEHSHDDSAHAHSHPGGATTHTHEHEHPATTHTHEHGQGEHHGQGGEQASDVDVKGGGALRSV